MSILWDSTRSVYLKKGKKFSYMGHRRWLPQGHSYRRQKKKFDETVENELAPKTMSGSSVLKMLEGRVFVYGKKDDPSKKGRTGKKAKSKAKGKRNTGKNKRKRETCKRKLTGGSTKNKKEPKEWLKKKSIFFSLPYWELNLLRHNLDVMHIEKNVCDNLIGTLLNIDSKSKDNRNARLDLVDMGIRVALHPDEDDKGKEQLPLAPFNMTKEQKEVLCSIIQKLRTPDGYASFLSRCVDMKDLTIKGMRSHDCHVLIEDILPAALRSCHPRKDVMNIACELADFFKNLCSKVLSVAELDKLQNRIF